MGVAGCGGLGSNAAVALVRAGLGRVILVDFDVVEASNLNRQYFFQADLGKKKAEVLRDRLREINPRVEVQTHVCRLTPGEVAPIFGAAEVLIEAFDRAEAKRWLIEAWCRAFPDRPIVCGNGLSGLGPLAELTVKRVGPIYFCGDGRTDSTQGLCSTRVAIVANMEAHTAIELLVQARGGK